VPRVVVAAPPAVRSPTDLETLPPAADLVELRLDLLFHPAGPEPDERALRAWIAASPRPVIATVRSLGQGGRFEGGAEAQARVLLAGARAGALWVDAEADVLPHLAFLPAGVSVLLSVHGEGPVPPAREAGAPRVRHLKVARPVSDAAALARLCAEAAAAGPDATCLPYGPLGALRVLFAHDGAFLYGSADRDSRVVVGQPALPDLLDELRAGEVTRDAALYGLLGRPPAHSPSPALHNAAFRALGRDAVYVPLPGVALETALALPFSGFSVTAPHKRQALELASEADALARTVGAANTLVRRGGAWHAANTDVEGVARSVPAAGPGEAAFVYGAGGFARAAAVALTARGYTVRLGARDVQAARRTARALDVEAVGATYERRVADRVVVNATPAGAGGEPVESLAAALDPDLLLLDGPYAERGRRTGLERLALAAGARCVPGRELLLRQAEGQARLFSGLSCPPDVLAWALEPTPLPLVLLGLRGAGKTTVARIVARRLGRPWVDLDAEVLRTTGRTPGWWLRERSEAAFREVETEALGRLVGRRDVVVAAGGGTADAEPAAALLASRFLPVLLDVDPGTSARRVRGDTVDRPLLAGAADRVEEARRLLARRGATWRRLARAVVDATRSADEVADDVARAWRDARRS
jgi:shikimate 5-dehydrogenase/shikimate kinase